MLVHEYSVARTTSVCNIGVQLMCCLANKQPAAALPVCIDARRTHQPGAASMLVSGPGALVEPGAAMHARPEAGTCARQAPMHTKSLALLRRQLLRQALLREAAAAPVPATALAGPVGGVAGAARAALGSWATSAGGGATRDSEASQTRPEVQLGCYGWDGGLPVCGAAGSLDSAVRRPDSRGDRPHVRGPESAGGGVGDGGGSPSRPGSGRRMRDAAGHRDTPDSAGGAPGSRGGGPGKPTPHQVVDGPNNRHAGGGRGTPDRAEGGPSNRECLSSSAVDESASRENCLDRRTSRTAKGRPGTREGRPDSWHRQTDSALEGPGRRGDCLDAGAPGIAERGVGSRVGGAGSAVDASGSSRNGLDGPNAGSGEGGSGSKLSEYVCASGAAAATVARLGERALELGSAQGGAALQRAAAKHGDVEGAYKSGTLAAMKESCI